MPGPNNKGNYPNDCFDDDLYNADAFLLRRYEGKQEWITWLVIVGRKNLEDGHEVFIKYGRAYWCYRGNINTLSAETRLKYMTFYTISETDLIDCEVEGGDQQPAAVAAVAKKYVSGPHGSSSDSAATRRKNQKLHDAAIKKAASKNKVLLCSS